MSASHSWFSRLAPRSFRAKFILVVGGAVLFDLLLGGGVALWNVQRLSTDAMQQVNQGLHKATAEYLRNYISTTAKRTELLFDEYRSQVNALAATTQALIDHPKLQDALGAYMSQQGDLSTPLVFNAQGNWWQNAQGAKSAVTVWGYLLDAQKQPIPDAVREVRDSAAFDLIGPGLMRTGPSKLQMYYMGPRSAPILRATPYSDQGKVFDQVYPGHNAKNWWDFFFPDLYENWQAWIKDPTKKPVASDITALSPYLDGVTGQLIFSFFHPLMTPDRRDIDGAVGVDLTLAQMSDIVNSVKIADTGFAFLAMSNGNILAVPATGERVLGVAQSAGTKFDRTLRSSSQPAIASLQLPTARGTQMRTVDLDDSGEKVTYVVLLEQLAPMNMYSGSGPVTREALTLGFMVPEREVYASLLAAQGEIRHATSRILMWQVLTVLLCLILVLSAVFAISGRITSGLSALAEGARRIQGRDYSVRVKTATRDEISQVGDAFNRMAEEISYHTENLEKLVEDRTRELESANVEISALNARLKSENLRLGAELDVARHIQMMVLPKAAELEAVPRIEIAGYMEPADEVGGDYYDVLQDGQRIKVGIGDVTGHGLESGVLMLMVQSVARALQEMGGNNPQQFLEVLNRAIYKNIRRTNSDKHLSLIFLDYEDRNITLSGQHEEVLVIRNNGAIERIDTMDLGFPIGLERDISPFVGVRRIAFDSGDVIVLHTDGVTEAESPAGELFGLDRLCESASRHRHGNADEIKAGILADLMAHIGSQKIYDDITLLVMRHR